MYKYRHDTGIKKCHHDAIILVLLYSCIALMLTTAYFGLKVYMLNGDIIKLERKINE